MNGKRQEMSRHHEPDASVKLSAPQRRMLNDLATAGGERAYWAAVDRMGSKSTFSTRAADRTLDSLVRLGLVDSGDEYTLSDSGRAQVSGQQKETE